MSQVHGVIYSGDEILRVISAATLDAFNANIGVGESGLVTPGPVNPEEDYILGGVITPRPIAGVTQTTTTINTGQTVTFNNIPNPCTVLHPGGEDIITDGFLDWSSTEPGNFKFEFWAYPHKPETLYVTVEL